VHVNQSTFSPSIHIFVCMAGSPTCIYDVSPDGANSSTKVDLSRRVIRLSFNSTPSGQSITSNGAGGSLAEAIIRLLFGDVCDRAGPFF